MLLVFASFWSAPLLLNPKLPVLVIVGNVDNPESTTNPVTPIETGFNLFPKL